MAVFNAPNVESEFITTTFVGAEGSSKKTARPDRYKESTSSSDLHQKQVKREESFSTLRSYYDRSKSPLAVSQQTSASSARDFALRKGCPQVIPIIPSDGSWPQTYEPSALLKRGASERRPSRPDFSTLFPKYSSRPEAMSSPKQYTASNPLLSATAGQPFKKAESQSFFQYKEPDEARDPVTRCETQDSRRPGRTAKPSFVKINVQKHRLGSENWFDGVEGEISEDDTDYEPNMAPDFVEKAFKTASGMALPEYAYHLKGEREDRLSKIHDIDCGSSKSEGASVSRRVDVFGKDLLCEILHNPDPTVNSESWGRWSPVVPFSESVSTALDLADLQQESVLCLSSSDDEDDNVFEGKHRPILEHEPFLRDSLALGSIDSDVETGTAQAIDTSFLRMGVPIVQPRGFPNGRSSKTKSRAPTFGAVEVPNRRSSRQGVRNDARQKASFRIDDNISTMPFLNRDDPEFLTMKRSPPTAPAAAQRQSRLIMALTPEEASLLKAIRSKKAAVRQNIVVKAPHVLADGPSLSKTPPTQQPIVSINFPQRSNDHEPVRLDLHAHDPKENCMGNPVSAESGLPSQRMSLIFSESVSSPTTGRQSPSTPILDVADEPNIFHGVNENQDLRLHTPKSIHFGHPRCRNESNSFIVLDNFPQPRKDGAGSEEYSWMLGQFHERADSTMIH